MEIKQIQFIFEINVITETFFSFNWNAINLDLSGRSLSFIILVVLELISEDFGGRTF